jgi:hypothetical protein
MNELIGSLASPLIWTVGCIRPQGSSPPLSSAERLITPAQRRPLTHLKRWRPRPRRHRRVGRRGTTQPSRRRLRRFDLLQRVAHVRDFRIDPSRLDRRCNLRYTHRRLVDGERSDRSDEISRLAAATAQRRPLAHLLKRRRPRPSWRRWRVGRGATTAGAWLLLRLRAWA